MVCTNLQITTNRTYEYTGTDLQMTTNKIHLEHVLYPALSFEIVGACFDVHNELGRFAREKQYGNLLATKLSDRSLKYRRELQLCDSGNIVDFLIEEKIILELKTARVLTRDYFRQVQNYLQFAKVDLGLLVNFSEVSLQPRRVIRIDTNGTGNVHSGNSQTFVDPHVPHSYE